MPGTRECIQGPRPSLAAFAPLRAVLLGQLDVMATQLAELMLDEMACYRRGGRELATELVRSCRSSLRDAIEVLACADAQLVVPTLRSRETGRRRARQGVPLEAVLRAYRLAGRVLWETMRREAQASPDVVTDESVLLDLAGAVWQLIDEQSSAVVEAYRVEEARLLGQDARERGAVLDALVEGRGHEPAVARDAARTLGLDLSGATTCPMVVIVAPLDSPRSDPLAEVQASLRTRGVAAAWHVRPGVEFGVVALERRSLAEILDLVEADVEGRVGSSIPIHRFSDVRSAFRLAETAARTLPPGRRGLARLADRLPEALLAGSPDIAVHLLGESFSGLLDLPERDRRPLLHTLEAVLDHDGSATHAAASLYCHRNTVIYRMRRIAALTGRDLNRPRDKMILMLAVMAARQRGLLDAPARIAAG